MTYANLSDWLDEQLGEDDSVELAERVDAVVETMNATGEVTIRPLAYLGGAYSRNFDSSLQIVSYPDTSEGFILREPGWKSEVDWGDWRSVGIVENTASPASVGKAFKSLCEPSGDVMFGIPQSIEIYSDLLTKESVREGMLALARDSGSSGYDWTGEGLVADAFDVSHDLNDPMTALAEAGIGNDDDFASLTPTQQELVVDLLVDATMRNDATT